MAATKKQQTPAATAPPAVMDPKFEMAEKAGSYVLRLALPGFRKDDFRVQVDGTGRLTVRGTGGQMSSFKKVFQLPSAASLDHIAGRFEAGVLTLTVPKRVAPTSVEEIRTKQPGVAKETKPKKEEVVKEDVSKKKKAMDDEATKKTRQQQKQVTQEEEASKSKQEQQKPAPAPVKEEEVKPKAPQTATAPPQEQEPTTVKKEEEMKPKAPQAAAATAVTPAPEKPAPKPEAATGSEKVKAEVAPESLAERVRRHSEEEHAKAAAEKEEKPEQEKKVASAACIRSWKERTMGELKGLTNMKWAEGLTDMKWADGVAETVRKNKEVVAVGIAAFSLGFIVSQRLLRK